MKYEKILGKKDREKIFKIFTENYSLKFNEIEKKLGLRSNKLAYYIKNLVKEGILEKKNEKYFLSKEAEKYIPFFSNRERGSLNPLPIVLVAAVHKNEVLLTKRKKRPYKDYWCMPGGKILSEETIQTAASRLLKEKTSIEMTNISINYIAHERVLNKSDIKHSFILFFTKAISKNKDFKSTTNEELKWFSISKLNKRNIVPSDYWLIKNKLKSKLNLKQFDMYERNGKLVKIKD